MLGTALVGAGTLLSGIGLHGMGRKTRTRGKVLLDKLPELPAGLRQAVQFPLIEAIQGRRSRRFPLGAEIPDGIFKFKSSHEPEPLTELEQMMVLTAVAGNRGWLNLIPYNENYLPHYSDMRAAVEAYVHRKFGEGGPFHSKTPGPYKNNPKTRGNGKIHNEEFIVCVTNPGSIYV